MGRLNNGYVKYATYYLLNHVASIFILHSSYIIKPDVKKIIIGCLFLFVLSAKHLYNNIVCRIFKN